MNIMNKLKLIMRSVLMIALTTTVIGCAGGKTYESTGEYFDNSMLTTKVKTTILGDSRLKVMQINVESFKGVVLLSGFVDSQAAADRAVELVRKIRGVKSVNNSLVVK
jgi:osmotically-inducible protein OsmY